MAAPKRTASPDTIEAIAEDVRFIRVAGGLARSGVRQLEATLAMLDPNAASYDDVKLAVARNLLATYVRHVCGTEPAPGDACTEAARQSLLAILTQPADRYAKAEVHRRAALATNDCPLKSDGLRKREDVLIKAIAVTAFDDLEQRRLEHGFQTVEEVFRRLAPVAALLHELLHAGLQDINPLEPIGDDAHHVWVTEQSLYLTACLLWWCRALVDVSRRVVLSRPTDASLVQSGQVLLTQALTEANDRDIVLDVVGQPGCNDSETFLQLLRTRPEAAAIEQRWKEWVNSCHEACTYHRSHFLWTACTPHRLLMMLEYLQQTLVDLDDGSLGEDVRELMGQGVPHAEAPA